jgi:hypothetical protein
MAKNFLSKFRTEVLVYGKKKIKQKQLKAPGMKEIRY